MAGLNADAIKWLHDHYGTISSTALAAVGISESQRRRLVEAGVLRRVVNGVYRFASAEDDELARCAAICAAHRDVVIAGPTAGRYWGIRKSPRDGLIHVIAAPFSRPSRATWLKVYRTSALQTEDVVVGSGGLRITNPSRTGIDLARYVPAVDLPSVVESVLSSRLGTAGTIRTIAERLVDEGAMWASRVLRVLDERWPGPPRESEWERRVLSALLARGVTGLACQVRERLPGYGSARFDIAIPDVRWVLEVDVHPYHRTIEGQSNDHRRDRHSRQRGYYVERVAEHELRAAFEPTMDELAASAHRRREEVDRLRDAGIWTTDHPI